LFVIAKEQNLLKYPLTEDWLNKAVHSQARELSVMVKTV
jgi:hypothetical protein